MKKPLNSFTKEAQEALLEDFPNVAKYIKEGKVSIDECWVNTSETIITFKCAGHTFMERTNPRFSGCSFGIQEA